MNETTQLLVAAVAAIFMVALIKAGVSVELRAAIRTTVVVGLGWGVAYNRHGPTAWSNLSWQEQGMLIISALAVLSSWRFHFRAIRARSVPPAAVTDRVNVGFALLFALLVVSGNVSEQSLLLAIVLICGTLILAFGRP
jgi:uncharacterized membrane protein